LLNEPKDNFSFVSGRQTKVYKETNQTESLQNPDFSLHDLSTCHVMKTESAFTGKSLIATFKIYVLVQVSLLIALWA
jgi:hypothetical protein